MSGLLEEGRELMSATEPGVLQDAMLITAAQKVEHCEIASYGTARTYAQGIGSRIGSAVKGMMPQGRRAQAADHRHSKSKSK